MFLIRRFIPAFIFHPGRTREGYLGCGSARFVAQVDFREEEEEAEEFFLNEGAAADDLFAFSDVVHDICNHNIYLF